MKIGIIGSGPVAQNLGTRLLDRGQEVMISSRNLEAVKERGPMGTFPSVNQWVRDQKARGRKASGGSFDEAAAFGEVLFNCTVGAASIDVLTSLRKDSLKGKILVDIANPLDFSRGMPPTLTICNTESLGERIQAAFPETKVVKTLNTVNTFIQVNPSRVPGEHDMFVAGNDAEAKRWVTNMVLMEWLGWRSVIDLGDITSARGTEMYLPLWLRLMGALGTPDFNIRIVRTPAK